MHMQPLYVDAPMSGGSAAEQHYAQGLCLPSGSSLSEQQQSRVIDTFIDAVSTMGTTDLTTNIDLRTRWMTPTHTPASAA